MKIANLSGISLIITLIVLTTACKQQPTSRSEITENFVNKISLNSVDSVFNVNVQNNEIPGGVMLVAKEGEPVYWKSFGFRDKEAQKPMRNNDIFRITFMSIPITDVALMILYDEGRFSLDDPVSKYIPEFSNPKVMKLSTEVDANGIPSSYTLEPATTEMTIRHLLNQTSGLSYGFYNQPFISDLYREAGISNGMVQTPGTVGDMVKKLAGLPLYFNPGERWHLGMNADVVGYLVEILSGKTLDEFIAERICGPLKMSDTYFFVPADKTDRIASLYHPQTDTSLYKYASVDQDFYGMTFTPVYNPDGPQTYFSGGAGLYSTAYDYMCFLQMLLNQGELGGVRLLKSETVQMMTSNQLGDIGFFAPGISYGFGFYVQTQPIEGMKGSSTGSFSWSGLFNTSFMVDPPLQMAYVVMCQHFPIGSFEVRDKVDRFVYREMVP
ncbi:MAG: serine hydrolase [Bacteroidales bacterium]|nr:beta-lactamase family protein [Lentimicrobiaceae bacterium]MDD5696287.1 serine hydrolase [Bacteroidales bacterium]